MASFCSLVDIKGRFVKILTRLIFFNWLLCGCGGSQEQSRDTPAIAIAIECHDTMPQQQARPALFRLGQVRKAKPVGIHNPGHGRKERRRPGNRRLAPPQFGALDHVNLGHVVVSRDVEQLLKPRNFVAAGRNNQLADPAMIDLPLCTALVEKL